MLIFAAGMKNLGTRIFAAILVVCYSMSIIGFGVHTCSENNRSFLTSFITGVECEDVHPSEICDAQCCSAAKHKNCCGHHTSEDNSAGQSDAAVKLCSRTCCTNDYQQIELTGSGHVSVSEKFVEQMTLIALCADSSFVYLKSSFSKIIQVLVLPDWGLYKGKLYPLLSVWRI